MNTLTEQQILANNHIQTAEIIKDIADTKKEIDELRLKIIQRQSFVSKLNQILKYRKTIQPKKI